MTTPLFPLNNGPISIKQGVFGDCYLLAALDCIVNSSSSGYERIKSLFTEVPGGVFVRLRHNTLSANLNSALLADKYQYSYDKGLKQDVFFISQAWLEEIDSTPGGVETNSLAFKILERLISHYYLLSPEKSRERKSSLSAHDMKDRFLGSSTIFVARILGLFACDTKDFEEVIKIKTICPEQPIYFSMKALSVGQSQQVTGRHAYTVDEIIADPQRPGEFNVVLVNPWDNQARENYCLEELRQRQGRFSLFVTNTQQFRLIQMLKLSDEAIGRAVFGNTALLQMVNQIQKSMASFNQQDIEYCALLNQQNPLIPGIFNRLNPFTQRLLINDMSIAKSNLQGPWHLRVMTFFAVDLEVMRGSTFYKLLIERARLNLWIALHQINRFLISFDKVTTYQGISKYCTFLIESIHTQIDNHPLLIEAERLLGFNAGYIRQHPMILQMIDMKVGEIHMLADQRRAEIDRIRARAARESYGLFNFSAIDSDAQEKFFMENEVLIWGRYI